jgi:hypothetical protein
MGGDFNAIMDKLQGGKQFYLRPWIEELDLVAPLTDTLLKSVVYQTHFAKDKGLSRIDHVFHSRSTTGITCSEVGTCNDTILVEHFDHSPVWIGIRLPNGLHSAGRRDKVKRPP